MRESIEPSPTPGNPLSLSNKLQGALTIDKLQVRDSLEPSPTLSYFSTLSIQGNCGNSNNCLGWEQGLSTSPRPKEKSGLEARVMGLSKELLYEGSVLSGHRERVGLRLDTLKRVSYLSTSWIPRSCITTTHLTT
ncbi:hypothetical protein Acr_15g0001450 [Actinidia rufa]|uniref:Uncharacterized protein n=1 Tax=Actinidia rufa TaxID=165716 RepID=A0A7J0FS52_9ERIC|nr:hypothetical protein Acr_15g0001450 [Actinidia rufa]